MKAKKITNQELYISDLQDEIVKLLDEKEKFKNFTEEILAKYWYENEYCFIDKKNSLECENSRLKFKNFIDKNLNKNK